jgi:hypothetical protein
MNSIPKSEPSLTKFDPRVIPYQYDVINLIRVGWDYNKGFIEVLLSGSIGSSKSTIAAHTAVTHCLLNPGARVALCRRALPDIKRTIFIKCLEQIENELVEGEDYFVNTTQATIRFKNGSEIISISYADKRYVKVRSIDLSAVIFEELIENYGDDIQAYEEIKMRVGRLPKIKEKWIISCTNPGGTSDHWYRYFFEEKRVTRFVFYSLTEQNPFLPATYINQLKENLDPKMARRMLYGEWIDINQERVYHAYDKARDYTTQPYKIDKSRPIFWSHDFNIGEGKPMSSILFQVTADGTFHFFSEIVIDGARTHDVCDELHARGILWNGCRLIIMGDSTGRSRDTRSIHSDYDILKTWATNHALNLQVEIFVPRANPPIRTRHNLVNAQCLNSLGQSRFMIHALPVADEGMRLTKLKPGGNYIEDDSFRAQHITTAIGYGIYAFKNLYSEDKQTIGSYER